MNEKLNKYLKTKTLTELASIKGLVSSMVVDYDRSLTTYASLNDDKFFTNMPKDVKEMMEKRNKINSLLMSINAIIEEKIFSLYE